MTETAPAIGHNMPPPFDPDIHAAFEARVMALCDEAGTWLDETTIDSEIDSEKANDFTKKLTLVKKEVDAARVAEKKVHDDASQAVQDAYKPLITTLDRAAKRVKDMLTPYLQKKQAEAEAEARRKAEEAAAVAEKARAEAEAAAKRNDVMGEVAAEEAAKRAAKLEKEAERAAKAKAKVQSYTGAGRAVSLRTVKEVEITNIDMVYLHFKDREEVRELLTRIATAEVRSRDYVEGSVPGITINEKKVAA